MEFYLGTSGWSYDWNTGGNLKWYTENSGLNAIELNASFYRFPFENYIRKWRMQGAGLRWSVKVHRSITHHHKFNEKALEIWGRFKERFASLDDIVDFYLFQAPPHFQDAERIQSFLESIQLKGRTALEVRDPSLLGDDDLCTKLQESSVLVSVDSPDFQKKIFPGNSIYLRIHGRDDWYGHNYSRKELAEILADILRKNPEKLFIFFNNNHHMLKNALLMRELLESTER
jgi:uncharacterized protein YecE (DUF72 family)